MKYTPIIPKTIGVREAQRQYRAVSKQLQKDDVLLVMNQGKPDMVFMSVKKYNSMTQRIEKLEEKLEIQDTLRLFKEAKELDKQGKLLTLHSLEDLIEKK